MKKSIGPHTVAMPAPVWIVGSFNSDGTPNAMTASWAGICCSHPPCLAVSLRKATHTYANIMRARAFTVNVPGASHVKETDYLGLFSGAETDKIAAAKLTAVRSEVVDAPYIEECPLVFECRVLHFFELGMHTQFVGEIVDAKADQHVLREDSMPDIDLVQPFCFNPGTRTYHAVGNALGAAFSIGREIAGPDRQPQQGE